jgi:hydroxymethylglutaryl-CoA lyase
MMMVYGQATRKFCRLSRQMTTKRYFFDDTSSVLCRQRRLLESTLTDRQSSIYQKQCSKRLFGSQSGGGDSVKIVEVGPRDGLQNESLSTNDVVVSVETKVSLIQKLASAGLTTIEVGSFVSPKWVPQMANSGEVVDAVHEWASKENVLSLNFPCLVPNQKGMEQAIQHGIQEIAIFGSASEAFSQKNIGCSIAESIDRFQVVVDMAKEHNVRIRGYLSCVVGCPYQGEVTPQEVGNVIEKLLKLGCYEVSLGDTIGVGTPGSVVPMLDTALQIADESKYAMHCHDTYGQALANIYASLERGIRTFDSSVAGLGGCPYAKGASGNVATEDVVYMV